MENTLCCRIETTTRGVLYQESAYRSGSAAGFYGSTRQQVRPRLKSKSRVYIKREKAVNPQEFTAF